MLYGYRLIPVSDTEYKVERWDGKLYTLAKKKIHWHCSCEGFRFRGDCKHLQLLPAKPAVQAVKEGRIPRARIDEILSAIRPMLEWTGGKWEIVGSYRRLLPDSKDVDIILQTDRVTFDRFKQFIIGQKEFKVKINGPVTLRGMWEEVPLDINRVDEEDWAPQLLYRTGSAKLNILMREEAKRRGWKLSEKGIFTPTGKLETPTEESIFRALQIGYRPPEER